jgi:hypothetical protein
VEQLSLGRRLSAAAVMVAVLLGVPLLAGALVGGQAGALASGLGGFFSLLLVLRAGGRIARQALPLLVVVIAAAAVTAGTWWWVVLLVLLGVLTGAGSTRGLIAPGALAGMLAGSTPPLAAGEDLGVRLALAALAGLYVLLVSRRLGLPDDVPALRAPPGTGVAIAVTLAAVVGVAATIALRWSDPHAYWVPVSVFLLSMPTPGVRIDHGARQRVLGTAGGLVAALPLVLAGVPQTPRLLLAVVLVLLVVVLPRPLWLNAALVTALLVLLLDAPSGAVTVGTMRLLDVAIAAALVLAGVAALTWWVRRHPPGAAQHAVTQDLVRGQRDVTGGL